MCETEKPNLSVNSDMRCLINVDFPEPEGPQKINGLGPSGIDVGLMAIRRINAVKRAHKRVVKLFQKGFILSENENQSSFI